MEDLPVEPPFWTTADTALAAVIALLILAAVVVVMPWLKQERDLWRAWRRLK